MRTLITADEAREKQLSTDERYDKLIERVNESINESALLGFSRTGVDVNYCDDLDRLQSDLAAAGYGTSIVKTPAYTVLSVSWEKQETVQNEDS